MPDMDDLKGEVLYNSDKSKELQKEVRNKYYRITINDIDFEWDTLKNETTIRKHGVSFEEAAEIFANPDTVIEYDDYHSDLEDRWNAIGYSTKRRALIVCHCYKDDTIIRIISARKASQDDISLYEENNQ